jgi:DMSO/TMAO reductase YedYZ molybdopterin-dependent catalytic subunit
MGARDKPSVRRCADEWRGVRQATDVAWAAGAAPGRREVGVWAGDAPPGMRPAVRRLAGGWRLQGGCMVNIVGLEWIRFL